METERIKKAVKSIGLDQRFDLTGIHLKLLELQNGEIISGQSFFSWD